MVSAGKPTTRVQGLAEVAVSRALERSTVGRAAEAQTTLHENMSCLRAFFSIVPFLLTAN